MERKERQYGMPRGGRGPDVTAVWPAADGQRASGRRSLLPLDGQCRGDSVREEEVSRHGTKEGEDEELPSVLAAGVGGGRRWPEQDDGREGVETGGTGDGDG
jgi:hypothetical protein